MPEMNYSSGPGGYTLTTDGSPGVGAAGYAPGSNQDLIDFYKEMARRAVPRMGGGGGGAMAAPPEATVIRRGPPEKSQADRARERDEILQMQARQAPAPMRMVTGPQIIPGLTMDTNAMNAYQRQAYLPQNSSRVFSPAEAAAAKSGYDEETDFSAGLAADRARTRGRTGEVGGAAVGTPGAGALAPGQVDPYERIRRASLNAGYGR